jgi:hypothetical protein
MAKAPAIALALLACLVSACTVFRFSLNPEPSNALEGHGKLCDSSFSFEYESEYSPPHANEQFFLERLNQVLQEFGQFTREPLSKSSKRHHLHVKVYRRFHSAAGQEWLTGLTFGAVPSTAKRETYIFQYTIHRDGVVGAEARFSLWSRAFSWIFLTPWGDLEESPTHYGRGAQLDYFQKSIEAFLSEHLE